MTAAGGNYYGLFQKRVDGDDALLELARLRFEQAGLAAEFYAHNTAELDHQLLFAPRSEHPPMVHLPRQASLTAPDGPGLILQFAERFHDQIRGLVMHDEPALASQPDDYWAAAQELDEKLAGISGSPWLFIEYATGVAPAAFARFANQARALQRTSVCIDVGHIGIFAVREFYDRLHAGEDVCSIKPADPRFESRLDEMQTSVGAGLPMVLELIRSLTGYAKPLHFHLHDGHPASTASPYGVCDHLSFLTSIPLPYEWRGRRHLPLLFRREGLQEILRTARKFLASADVSYALEVHPTGERRALDEGASLFAHWRDKTHAEKMNHWLQVLAENAALLKA